MNSFKNSISHFGKIICAITALLQLGLPSSLWANTDMRDWKFKTGEIRKAELLSTDDAAKTLVLRNEAGEESTFKVDDLSPIDQAWVLEWSESTEEVVEKVKQLGGTISHHQGRGAKYLTDFYVYEPLQPNAPAGDLPPLMILFDAGGKGLRYLLKHIEAGQAVGMTLVGCDVFKNHMDDVAGLARFKELLPAILASTPHNPERIFMGGSSGGAWRAFHHSAQVESITWAGIYSNGGWLGEPEWYDLPYPPQLRVAMVNGDKDHANEQIELTRKVLAQHGVKEMAVMAFEGGHQVPPMSVQTKAFKWLLKSLQ
jgi:predicted esterase